MSTDPWLHMLLQLEPEYYAYKDSIEKGFRFEIKLSDPGIENCYIRIQGVKNGYNFLHYEYKEEFMEKYKWTAKQLASWSNCCRITDISSKWQWHFKHRKDAEKFKTLFTLKWAK